MRFTVVTRFGSFTSVVGACAAMALWAPAHSAEGGAPPAHKAIDNAAVIDLTRSHLDESIILSVIASGPDQFDTSPDALIALKQAGVSNQVIIAMMQPAHPSESSDVAFASAPTAPQSTPPIPAPAARSDAQGMSSASPAPMPGFDPRVMAAMAAGDPRALAAMQSAMMRGGASGGFPQADSSPLSGGLHVYLLDGAARTDIASSSAQRAVTKTSSGEGASALKSIASEALSFGAMAAGPGAGMAMSGMSMFRSFLPGMEMGGHTQTITYAWGLPGDHSQKILVSATPAFEVHYADIPGLDPDAFEPVLLRLAVTRDNYRILGATKEKTNAMSMAYGSSGGSVPPNWFAEDRVELKIQTSVRGIAMVSTSKPLSVGEYALVLRPVKHYRTKPSGFANTDQLTTAAWDFSLPAGQNH